MNRKRIDYNPFDKVKIPMRESFTSAQLAEILGISAATVSRDIVAELLVARSARGLKGSRCLGITYREALRYLDFKRSAFGGRTSTSRTERIYEMLDRGVPNEEIARRMGMKVASIRRTCERRKARVGGVDSRDVSGYE